MADDFLWIADDHALETVCAELAQSRSVAVDTEFVGEKTYWPVLELVQLAGDDARPAVIDVRAVRDFGPLQALLADPSREKIVHAGAQDLPLLARVVGAAPTPVFDTQIAAAMVGLGAQISYAALAERFAGARVDKSHTMSDWSRRPLESEQLAYAAQDVRHLHAIRAQLGGRLTELGREAWFAEEQALRTEAALRSDEPRDDDLYRIVKDWAKLRGVELAVLHALAKWREDEARARDLPRRRVLPDEALIHLARRPPRARADLSRLPRGVPARAVERHADDLVRVARDAAALPPDAWPQAPERRAPDAPPCLSEILAAVVRATADDAQIASTLLATSKEITALVAHRDDAEPPDLPVVRGWRRALVGETLLMLLRGERTIRIVDGHRLVVEPRD